MTGQQWFGVVIEGQNGRRRFRHVNTAVYSSWESLGRVVAVELAALGAGARVVKLEECSPIDHLDGPAACRFARWELPTPGREKRR